MRDFDSFERRRTDRRPLEAEGTASFASDLRVVNVGPRGIEIETSDRLMVGADYDFQVRCKSDLLAIRGTVVWSKLDRTIHTHDGEIRPIYRAGIEAASSSIPALERLIDLPGVEVLS
jgi:hypothetical protein